MIESRVHWPLEIVQQLTVVSNARSADAVLVILHQLFICCYK